MSNNCHSPESTENLRRCIYCDRNFQTRNKGDHLIPQGFGDFSPNLILKCVCKECDEKHGGEFELIALRSGMIAVFRKIYGIQSRSSRKKRRRPLNPTLDRQNTVENLSTRIISRKNDKERLYLNDAGEVCATNSILVAKSGIEIDRIYIPATRSIRDICEFVESRIDRTENITYQIEIHTEDCAIVMRELERRGYEFGKVRELTRVDEIIPVTVSSLITEVHLKLVTNMAIKAMILMGYERELLLPLINYVHEDKKPSIFIPKAYRDSAKESGIDNPNLNEFSHRIEWSIDKNSITILADLMSHERIQGLHISLCISSGPSKRLLIPYGRMEARYAGMRRPGTLKLFKGNLMISGEELLKYAEYQ